MATLTTASMTRKDTLLTIKIRDDCKFGLAWEGRTYYAGETVTLPAFWAARWIGNGRAELVQDGQAPDGRTPAGMFEARDPVVRRGRH